jgi:hypothetical protein
MNFSRKETPRNTAAFVALPALATLVDRLLQSNPPAGAGEDHPDPANIHRHGPHFQ